MESPPGRSKLQGGGVAVDLDLDVARGRVVVDELGGGGLVGHERLTGDRLGDHGLGGLGELDDLVENHLRGDLAAAGCDLDDHDDRLHDVDDGDLVLFLLDGGGVAHVEAAGQAAAGHVVLVAGADLQQGGDVAARGLGDLVVGEAEAAGGGAVVLDDLLGLGDLGAGELGRLVGVEQVARLHGDDGHDVLEADVVSAAVVPPRAADQRRRDQPHHQASMPRHHGADS